MFETIFGVVTGILGFMLVMGLISPKSLKEKKEVNGEAVEYIPTRKETLKIFGSMFVISFIIWAIIGVNNNVKLTPEEIAVQAREKERQKAEKEREKPNLPTLESYANASEAKRKQFIKASLIELNINKKHEQIFYNCMSHKVFEKNKNLETNKIFGWCKLDFDKGIENIAWMSDLHKFEKQFHPWDGSHRNLERLIKDHMNNEDSYDHVKTTYRLVLDKNNPHAVINTIYKGQNAFGGIVKEQVTADVDLNTGQILKIHQG